MEFSFLHIIFYILLLDSLFANLFAWTGKQTWWNHMLGKYAHHMPLARGWTTYYLILVLFIGYLVSL